MMQALHRLLPAALAVGLLALSPPAEAQFLKKLVKGLDKVSKTLDKVDKAVNQDNTKSANTKSTQPTTSTDSRTTGTDDSSWKAPEAVNIPYADTETKFMRVDNIFSKPVSDVRNGVFAVKQGGKFAFWLADGRKLFDADWEYCSEGGRYGDAAPTFSGGVAPARRAKANAQGKKPVCLLYKDGRVKELDPAIEQVSTFVDGVALATKNSSMSNSYFYINARGERLWPALTVYGRSDEAARPLCDGLRAWRGTDGTWGYIDKAGKVVLAAKYSGVRDFSDGFAWVVAGADMMGKGQLTLIDKTGKAVYTPGIEMNGRDLVRTGTVSDVHDGRFYIEKGSDTYYYDTAGKELYKAAAGNAFFAGNAFVTPLDGKPEGTVSLIDKDFNTVRLISDDIVPRHVLEEYGPCFGDYGLATLSGTSNGDFILTPDGKVLVRSWDDHNGNYSRGFRPVSESGYARVENIRLGDTQYVGLMKPDGYLAWLFATDAAAGGPFEKERWEKMARRDLITGDGPWTFVDIDITIKPIGPTTVTQTRYNVAVAAVPGDGGTVKLTPSASYLYGDYATVSASANKDWAVSYIETSLEDGATPTLGEPFAVTADQKITVHFVKKDDDKTPPLTGIYQGMKNIEITTDASDNIAVYAEISSALDNANPYGDHTHGFLVMMFDPTKRYVGKDLSTYVFSGPLRVSGYQRDEAAGKDWLVLDGGNHVFGNLKIRPNGAGGLGGIFMDMMMAFDGNSSPDALPRHYRVEMLDWDKTTGEFTLGNLETFSPRCGWVPGGDKCLDVVTKGIFSVKSDHGFPADFFNGVRLKAANKRDDVVWYPPLQWYDGNEGLLQSIVKQMGNSYRNYSSDYELLFRK